MIGNDLLRLNSGDAIRVYPCEYCGRKYTSPIGMARCVINCWEEYEEKRQEEYLEKLEREIEELYKNLKEKVEEFNSLSQYGKYEVTLT